MSIRTVSDGTGGQTGAGTSMPPKLPSKQLEIFQNNSLFLKDNLLPAPRRNRGTEPKQTERKEKHTINFAWPKLKAAPMQPEAINF